MSLREKLQRHAPFDRERMLEHAHRRQQERDRAEQLRNPEPGLVDDAVGRLEAGAPEVMMGAPEAVAEEGAEFPLIHRTIAAIGDALEHVTRRDLMTFTPVRTNKPGSNIPHTRVKVRARNDLNLLRDYTDNFSQLRGKYIHLNGLEVTIDENNDIICIVPLGVYQNNYNDFVEPINRAGYVLMNRAEEMINAVW